MTPEATDTLTDIEEWRIKANIILLFIGLFFLPLMSHAGGLGIAALGAIIGGFGILTSQPPSLLRIPGWVWAVAAFVLWAAVTSFWSPYVDTQKLTNPWKLLIGFALYSGCILSFKMAAAEDRNLLRHLVIALAVLSIGLLLIDIMSGYALTFLVDPLGPDEIPLRKHGDTEMNIGHAITVSALMMSPVMMMMRRQLTAGWLFSIIFATFVGTTALLGSLSIGILAVAFSLIAMMVAKYKPVTTLRALIWLGILSIVLAPLVGYLLGLVSETTKASLPFSWEHRIEMWTYTTAKIFEAPLLGHGFDAVRTFDDTFSSRGIESWPIVSLHPHNAGLHIWVETGLIGVGLAVFALIMIGTALEYFILASPHRATAMAGFIAAVILISNVTYGVWQDWWWATILLTGATNWLLPRN